MARDKRAEMDDQDARLKDAAALSEASYYILLALAKPLHGYGIGQKILAMTGGRLRIGPGTMYGALKNMQLMGLTELADGGSPEGGSPEGGSPDGRRIVYRLSPLGRKALAVEALRLGELLRNFERYGGEA